MANKKYLKEKDFISKGSQKSWNPEKNWNLIT